MKESTLLALKNRVNDLTQFEQGAGYKIMEIEAILTSIIKLLEFLPGYDEAKEKLQESNKQITDESIPGEDSL